MDLFTNICPTNHPNVGQHASTMEHMALETTNLLRRTWYINSKPVSIIYHLPGNQTPLSSFFGINGKRIFLSFLLEIRVFGLVHIRQKGTSFCWAFGPPCLNAFYQHVTNQHWDRRHFVHFTEQDIRSCVRGYIVLLLFCYCFVSSMYKINHEC